MRGKRAELIPGQKISLVLDINFTQENVVVRTSQLYEARDNDYVIAQTNPPLASRYVGRKIAVTYLTEEEDEQSREGFYGVITACPVTYRLHAGDLTSALIVRKDSEIMPFNIRMHYRVHSGSREDIAFLLRDNAVTVIDLSIGGVKLAVPLAWDIEPRSIIPGTLVIDNHSIALEARVVRIHEPYPLTKNVTSHHVALAFRHLSPVDEGIIAKKVRQIEREELFRDMYPE